MSTFQTPEPISVTVDLSAGDVRITASDRADTVVQVRPRNKSNDSDVQAAQQVRVDYANGLLRIIGPKGRVFGFAGRTRSVEVTVELPTGSAVAAEVQAGGVDCAGGLGECRVKLAAGNTRVERTGPLRVDTAAGHVSADAVEGNAEIHTGSGDVRLGTVEGGLVVKNSNGTTDVDSVAGDARVRSANGSILIERAGAGVEAKTANGSIRVGEVVCGAVTVETSLGDVEVGIARGTAAWLDANTSFGNVRNMLDEVGTPGEAERTAEVRARTSFGDVTIRRS
jgi:hypothetical protein